MATTEHPPTRDLSGERKWVGKVIRRVEDPRFLRGRGGYIDDMRVPGMLHAAIVRSPLAHARIVSIDVEAARRLPRVGGGGGGPRGGGGAPPTPHPPRGGGAAARRGGGRDRRGGRRDHRSAARLRAGGRQARVAPAGG